MNYRRTLTLSCCLVSSLASGHAAADSPSITALLTLATPPSQGPTVGAPLGNILFTENSVRIAQALWPVLRTAAALARQNPDIVIELEGYADVRGSRTDNHTLAFKRAQAVAAFLLRNGVDIRQIAIVSHGETRASANVNDHAGQAYDRRVSISLASRRPRA